MRLLAKEVLPHFESRNRFPVPLYPHYPKHLNFINLPSATWLALGRYPRKYVDYAQLNVGLSKQFHVIIRLLFEIGKKSVDFPKFKKWINIRGNKERVEKLKKRNEFVFLLGKEYVENKVKLYKVEKFTSIDKALSQIYIFHATSFEIGKQYNKNHDIVKSEKLAEEVIEVFKTLYPIYREIGQAE